MRQKTHDKRLSYEIFNANDSVYVLFPVIKRDSPANSLGIGKVHFASTRKSQIYW